MNRRVFGMGEGGGYKGQSCFFPQLLSHYKARLLMECSAAISITEGGLQKITLFPQSSD